VLFILLFFLDLILGATYIPLGKIIDIFGPDAGVNETIIILGFRLPKAIAAICAGMGLSVAGLLMQTFFRNPLAGPYVLGVNSLASLFVAAFMLTGVGSAAFIYKCGMPAMAFGGALCGLLILLSLSRKISNTTHLLLIGMMIGFLAGALQSVLEYLANPSQLKNFVLWNMASLSNVTGNDLLFFSFVTLVICLSCIFLVKPLNLLLLGDEQATLLGVNTRLVKTIMLIIVAILSGLTTAYCGPVGFVGLAMPHLVRLIFKTTHHLHQLIGSILVGSCFMLFCDIIGNLPVFEMTLPVNVITSLLGAPFVLWLIFRNKNRFD
jgi:iron complex transport system permease protein